MPNQHETTITNHLVNILRNMRHGWEVETAVHAFIKGNSELDALVIERGRETHWYRSQIRYYHQC